MTWGKHPARLLASHHIPHATTNPLHFTSIGESCSASFHRQTSPGTLQPLFVSLLPRFRPPVPHLPHFTSAAFPLLTHSPVTRRIDCPLSCTSTSAANTHTHTHTTTSNPTKALPPPAVHAPPVPTTYHTWQGLPRQPAPPGPAPSHCSTVSSSSTSSPLQPQSAPTTRL
jgi:hypothetical protein